MKYDMRQDTGRYQKAHRWKKRWYKIVAFIACAVVFCTVYALILPAITLETDKCQLPEHTHTVECYTQVTSIQKKVLICDQQTENAHSHTEACRDGEGNLVCGFAEDAVQEPDAPQDAPTEPVHTHTEACFTTERGELVCEEHIHSDACYTESSVLICTQEESEEHSHGTDCWQTTREWNCGMESDHQHTDACYQQVSVLCCGFPEEPEEEPVPSEPVSQEAPVSEHQHDDACYTIRSEPVDTEALTCTSTEEGHVHGALCYGIWELTCGMEEHTHSEACRGEEESPEDEQAQVAGLIAMIDALPTSEEVEQQLMALEDAGDDGTYEAYYRSVSLQAQTAYAWYEDMETQLQEQVTNRDKLLELIWLWTGRNFGLDTTLTVYQINRYSQAVTTLVYGGSVRDKLGGGMSFTYWDAIVVEENETGELYVSRYETADGDKRDYAASTANGLVILLYNTTVNTQVGDKVSVDFNYKADGAYNSAGYGAVGFGLDVGPKEDKDNSGSLTVLQGADTRSLIEVNLYDYGSNINDMHNSDPKYPGFQQEYGSRNVGDSFSKWQSFNFGNNITSDLAAGKPDLTNKGGAINATTNDANSPISGAMQTTLGADGYPALSDGTSLSYLFTNNAYATRKNSQSINGLFLYHPDSGAYTFNSRENHAQFNPGSDTFTLYRQIITPNFMMYPFGNFLPFNDIVHLSAQTGTIDRAYLQSIADSAAYKYSTGSVGQEYQTLSTQLGSFIRLMDNAYPEGWGSLDCMNEYFKAAGIPSADNPKRFSAEEVQNLYSIDFDEPTDFYFGMEMKMRFMQPRDGLTGKDNNQDGQPDYPMVFDFYGDDDVWVYIDGQLFLDLSGIHRHVGGTIDFTNGVVKYYALDVATGNVSATPYKTVPFSDLGVSGLNSKGCFEDYSTHTFRFYYMERGSGSGVCRMNFNFPILRKNTISIQKQVTAEDGELLGNPDFRFQVLKEGGTELFIAPGTAYDILDAAGVKIAEGITDSNGVFSLKANQTAVFGGIPENAGTYFVRELLDPDAFGQYGTIRVNGIVQTTSHDILMGSDTFKGVDSPVKDMADGSTSFTFDNHVEFEKLGSLSITKTLTGYSDPPIRSEFEFEVKLDGIPLPVGTAYTVGTQTRTVATAGSITLAPGETATISNILSGSRFTVAEIAASSEGYSVTYKVDGVTVSNASGTITTDATVAVLCNNIEPGTSIEIPVEKTLQKPDGAEHSYLLLLQQVTAQDGSTPVSPAFTRELPISITIDPVTDKFVIQYPKSGLGTLPQAFYYKITEQVNTAEIDTVFDPSIYVVEVTVTAAGDTLTAEITQVWKDGTQISETGQAPSVSFTNEIVRYELPKTGGEGTGLYTMGGLLLITGVAFCLFYYPLKRRKEDILSS